MLCEFFISRYLNISVVKASMVERMTFPTPQVPCILFCFEFSYARKLERLLAAKLQPSTLHYLFGM